MIQAFHDHADHRDEFEFIAIHDSTVKSFDELDEKIAPIQKLYWKGESLPFPVLIDNEGKTEETFGISAHPSLVVIDPDGNVVGLSSLRMFEKHLTPLTADVKWARERDLQKNIHWTFNEETTVGMTLTMLGRFAQSEFKLDPALSDEVGLSEETKLPLMIEGYGITLRSIEQLLLDGYDVEFQPSDDGKSLVLRKSDRSVDDPPSHFQQLHNQQLRDRIAPMTDQPTTESTVAGTEGESKTVEDTVETEEIGPLEIKEIRLRDAVSRIASHFSIPMGINAPAYKSRDKIVSGTITNEKLEASLNDLLEPAGLKVIVKYEMVLVVPLDR